MSPLKIAVIGSREFNDYERMSKILGNYTDIIIISGGARGADALAKRFALENDIKYIDYPADWGKYGKSAGYIRNKDIISNSDIVIAFWDGKSKGTAHSLQLAKKLDKPTHIVYYTAQSSEW